MRLVTKLAVLCAAVATAFPALAGDGIDVSDPYARAASASAKAGAVFMTIANSGAEDDRLIAADTDAAMRVELHTHVEDTGGVMRMVRIEDGIAIPAGGMAELKRGGLHVMLMGLTGPLEQGAEIELTLTFETAGEMVLTVPVDNERLDAAGHGHNHGN